MTYLVIALWKLEKPIVRKAPSGAFRYLYEQNIKSSLSYHFCKEYGDLQSDYLNVKNYDYTGKKKNVINKMVKIMSGQLRYDSDYAYIRHYMNTYQYVTLMGVDECFDNWTVIKNICQPERTYTNQSLPGLWHPESERAGEMLTVMTKFSGDIFSNITISAPQLGLKEAWEAAEMAGVADDIRNMPMGMQEVSFLNWLKGKKTKVFIPVQSCRKNSIVRRYPSKRMQQAKVCPYLLRNAVIDRPNQVWSINITYILIKRGFLYLTQYNNIREARKAIGKYVHIYNFERCHSALNNQTPASCYYPILLLDNHAA